MKEKLVRNTSDERWREFWKAVDAAAANAPKLQFTENKSVRKPSADSSEKKKRPAQEV